jgi:CTP synthase
MCERVSRLPVEAGSSRVPDVCIIELGGTVGDIESGPFVEAMRQFRWKVGPGNFLHIFVSLVPVVAGEQKTKPTQQAVKESCSAGLSPDFIACRCSRPPQRATIKQMPDSCDVGEEHVIAVRDVSSTYHVPMFLHGQNLSQLLWTGLRLDAMDITAAHRTRGDMIWNQWKELTSGNNQHYEQVDIALVGKYANHKESYISVIKSLEHAAMAIRKRVNVTYVNSSHLESKASDESPADYHQAWTKICTAHGILVPGGFGIRGSEGTRVLS